MADKIIENNQVSVMGTDRNRTLPSVIRSLEKAFI